MRILTLAVAALLTAGISAPVAIAAESNEPSSATPAQPAAPAKKVESDDDKIVCELVKAIGSNMKKRVCKSVAQIRREREEAQDTLSRESRLGER